MQKNKVLTVLSLSAISIFTCLPLQAESIENENRYLATVLSRNPFNSEEVGQVYLTIKAMRESGREEGLEKTLKLAYGFCERAKKGKFDFHRSVRWLRETQGETEAFRMMALNYYLCPELL